MNLLLLPAIVHLCAGLTNMAIGISSFARNQKLVGMITLILGGVFLSLYAMAIR